jgi:membrane associated rhomboid family serine protease
MSVLVGSLESSPLGGVPESRETTDAQPSLAALEAIHADGVALARGRMLTALSSLVPYSAIVLASVYTRAALPFLGLVIPLLIWIVDETLEWWSVRRTEPLEFWRRDQQEQVENRVGTIEHQERLLTTTPAVSYALGAAVVAVTTVQFLGPGVKASLPLAALVKPAVRAGEWWRLLSAAFLHGGVYHVLGNLSGLLAFGTVIEFYDRRARVPLAFLVGVMCCSLASTLAMNATSLGASGGVLALAGYLLGARVGPSGATGWIKRQVHRTLILTAAFGVIGFMFIDNAGHIGGVLGGFAVGAVCFSVSQRGGDRTARRLDALGWISAMILASAAIFTTGRLLQAW